MTWGECKLLTLQAIYSNEGKELKPDDSNREYLDAMPGKANEGMQQITLVGRPILRSARIHVGALPEEGAEEQGVIYKKSGQGTVLVDLPREVQGFRALDRLILTEGGNRRDAERWAIEGDNVLALPARVEGEYTLYYKARPTKVTAQTTDDWELDLSEDAAALLPIFMAAELYKEDDLSLATVLRNEYEDGLQKLRAAWEESGGGMRLGHVVSETGWW